MRHFDYLTEEDTASLFAVPPTPFSRASDPGLVSVGLGATLYSPGNRATLADDALRAAAIGARSQVWCLEDSIGHAEVRESQTNVVRNLKELGDDVRLPLLFVRVRSPRQIAELVEEAGESAALLTGFVLPKFAPGDEGEAYLQVLADCSAAVGQTLYALPVLEHPDLAWRESRQEHLSALRELLDRHRSQVLMLRVGGTDLCGLFGIRRDRDTTVWDVAVVRDMLGDVVNVFARRGDYVVSGPVWEHFQGPGGRLFKPQLRATPFEGRMRLRQAMLRDDADELLREVLLDRANGFHGKTVIHPTHVAIVNTLQTVSKEEHDDALTVLDVRGQGGAVRSAAFNKMNEIGPHELWAEQIVARAKAYGVVAHDNGIIELLERGRRVAEALYSSRS